MRKIAFMVCLLGCLCSCQHKKEVQEPTEVDPVEKDLQAEVLFTSDDLDISTPHHICLINDSIIVTQQVRQETFLDVWNVRTKKHLNKLLKRGEGPSEFLYAHMSLCEKEKSLFVNDILRKSMYRIGYGELMKTEPRVEKVLQWDVDGIPRLLPEWIYHIGGDNYFSINSTDSARFMILRPERVAKTFGEYPDKNKVDPKLTPMANASLYKKASVAISPDYKKVMVFQDFADMITLIDLSGEVPVVSSKINTYPNDIKLLAAGEGIVYALTTDDTYRYYSAVCRTKDYVYVLWGGYEWRDELDKGGDMRCKTVKVFDWDGNLCYILHIDKPVFDISVSSDNKTLVAVSDQNDYEIYRYQLDLD